jgi:hypothetical protein
MTLFLPSLRGAKFSACYCGKIGGRTPEKKTANPSLLLEVQPEAKRSAIGMSSGHFAFFAHSDGLPDLRYKVGFGVPIFSFPPTT